jgi:preprotein translocase subunit Sec61beta
MDHEPSKEIPARPRVGLAQTARAVLWSFFGVRRKSDYEKDANQLSPIYVIITGVAAAALFVIVLIVIVNLVVR